ncbi:response regulator receiver protein [Pseudomonas sp. AU11447]|uniref:response regulator n=1 Tax=unclassified Pseudomonas TaxID=196821 RepID=UPI0006D476EB|nr:MULTISPECIES: response regulator [unclassified Pseudomonas]OBY88743.1 response regulator receiver protein [Pseudomonas sp. AU11447]
MINRHSLDDDELEALRDITPLVAHRPVILVVDDDRAALARLRRLVEGAGMRCVTASSAAEALRRILRDEAVLDLLVSGLGLEPDGPGLAFIRELNRTGTFLPIIVLSAPVDIRGEPQETPLNVLDFLPKPVDPMLFVRALCRSFQS